MNTFDQLSAVGAHVYALAKIAHERNRTPKKLNRRVSSAPSIQHRVLGTHPQNFKDYKGAIQNADNCKYKSQYKCKYI